MKYKDKILKDEPKFLSRLYKYLLEYRNKAKVIKTERKSSKVSQTSNGTNKSNKMIELENSDAISEQVTNHYITEKSKNKTDNPAAENKTKCCDPKTKESTLDKSGIKILKGSADVDVSNDECKQKDFNKQLNLKPSEDKIIRKA